MPELPEVETMVRGVRPFMEQRRLLKIRPYPCKRKPLTCSPSFNKIANCLQNSKINRVTRIAKRIITEFETPQNGEKQFLLIEPRMTGLLLVEDPPSQEHLRFEFVFENSSSFKNSQPNVSYWDRRGLGTVTLYDEAQFQNFLNSGRLGPDALQITSAQLYEKCAKTKRPIKVALLDQKLVAGIGNLYASEILFLCKIHPETPANEISKRKITSLVKATQTVLQTAIEYEGSTLSDGTYRNVLNQDGGYQNEHRVYQKAGEACMKCKQHEIVKIVQAQRSTFFCPCCQRL